MDYCRYQSMKEKKVLLYESDRRKQRELGRKSRIAEKMFAKDSLYRGRMKAKGGG